MKGFKISTAGKIRVKNETFNSHRNSAVAYLQEISFWNNFKLAQYFNLKLSQIIDIYKEILLIVREIS